MEKLFVLLVMHLMISESWTEGETPTQPSTQLNEQNSVPYVTISEADLTSTQENRGSSNTTVITNTDEYNSSDIVSACTNCSSESEHLPKVFSTDYVGYVSVPLLLVIGICGNTLTIIIMRNAQFRSTTFSLILTSLAVSDTLLIVLLPFNKDFVRTLLGTDIRAISSVGCKMYFLFFRSAKMTSSWFVVFLAFERFLAVWFPLRVKEISSKRNTSIAIFAVYILIFTYNGTWTFSSTLINNVCVPNLTTPGQEGLTAAFLLTGLIVYFFIPATILVIITPLTTVKLMQQHRLRRKLTKGHSSKSDEIIRTTIMLVGVTIAFVILVAPIAFVHLIAHFRNVHIFESTDPSMVTFRNISQLMEQTNYTINFFLYVICNRTFRNRCLIVTGCRNRRNRQDTLHCSNFLNKSESATALSNITDM